MVAMKQTSKPHWSASGLRKIDIILDQYEALQGGAAQASYEA